MLRKKVVAVFIAYTLFISLLVVTQTACPNNANSGNTNKPTCDLVCRVAQASGGIVADVEKELPNLDQETKTVVEKGALAFKDLFGNPTLSNYQKAFQLWNDEKSLLARYNNTFVNLSVIALDVLISQIEVPASAKRASETGKAKVRLNFKEADVKRLEELVKTKSN